MCNLPSGFYGGGANGQADAIRDASKFDDFTIPNEFIGSGFLIARLTFLTSGGGATWTLIDSADLRGLVPSQTAGSGIGQNISAFSDTDFEVFDDADISKEFGFQLSGVTAGSKRIVTIPDADGNMAYTSQTDGTIVLTTDTIGNYAAGDAEAGDALTGDAALNFFGAGVTAVTDATACTDIEGTSLAIAGATLNVTGLVIGTDVQAWDTQLDDIAALAVTNSNFIVGDGANWVAETGATARTSIGLGTGDAVEFASVKADNTTLNNDTLTTTGGGDLTIASTSGGIVFDFTEEADFSGGDVIGASSLITGTITSTAGSAAAIVSSVNNQGLNFASSLTANNGPKIVLRAADHATLKGQAFYDYGDNTGAIPAGAALMIRSMDNGTILNVIKCDAS